MRKILLHPGLLKVSAQQPKKVPRIGFFAVEPLSTLTERTEAFLQGLRELGYIEAKNIVVEWRSRRGKSGSRAVRAANESRPSS